MNADWNEEIGIRLDGIGPARAEFIVDDRRLYLRMIVAPLMILAGTILDGGVLWGLARGKHNHALLHLGVVGLVLVLGGIMLVVRAVRNRGTRVLIYPEGLVRINNRGAQAVFWDQITTVIGKKNDGGFAKAWYGTLVYRLMEQNGRWHYFDDSLPRLQELGELFMKETLPILLPGARAALRQGMTLDFEKLQINREGLKVKSAKIAWGEIEKFECDEDTITINKRGKWSRWFHDKTGDIPNFHVFRELVNEHIRLHQAPQAKEA